MPFVKDRTERSRKCSIPRSLRRRCEKNYVCCASISCRRCARQSCRRSRSSKRSMPESGVVISKKFPETEQLEKALCTGHTISTVNEVHGIRGQIPPFYYLHSPSLNRRRKIRTTSTTLALSLSATSTCDPLCSATHQLVSVTPRHHPLCTVSLSA